MKLRFTGLERAVTADFDPAKSREPFGIGVAAVLSANVAMHASKWYERAVDVTVLGVQQWMEVSLCRGSRFTVRLQRR